MHRTDDSRFLLYIEPKAEQKSETPINDDITQTVEDCFNKAISGTANYSDLNSEGDFMENNGWMGSHITACGRFSDSNDYLLENGMITNSLCVFYLKYYRAAIPESEMRKVIDLCEWAKKNGMKTKITYQNILAPKIEDWLEDGWSYRTEYYKEQDFLNKDYKQEEYDPTFGDNKECECGHPYHRHFDSYEDMMPANCKYCGCNEFKEKK